MRRWWLVSCLSLPCALACKAEEKRTEIMVVLDAEAGMRAAAQKLEVVVKGSNGREGSLRTERFLQTWSGGADGIGWPRQIAVTPLDDDPSRIFEVVATALGAGDDELGRVRAIGGFVHHETRMLLLVMEDQCRAELCTEETTCRKAECEDAHFDAKELPPYDPRLVEALRKRGQGLAAPSCARNNGGCDRLTSCRESDGEITCGACPRGYSGDGASGCSDVDECLDGSADCDPGVPCVNVAGSYRCGDCPAGFAGGGARGCVDVDECGADNGGCDAQVTCTNTAGGFRCGACPVGFTGLGSSTCLDVNECDTDDGGCDPLTTCINVDGGRQCGACPSGYAGDGENGCTDIDECLTENGGCDPRVECANTEGGRTCGDCPSGYTGDGESGCADINECAAGGVASCDPLAPCVNSPGSFSCGSCPSGYGGSGDTGCNRLLSALGGTGLFAFVPDTTSYMIQADALDDTLLLSPQAGPLAIVRVNGVPVPQGQPYSVPLAPSAVTPITVVVSEVGHPDTTYTIEVTRSASVTQDHYIKPETAILGSAQFGSVLAMDGDVLATVTPQNQQGLHIYRRQGDAFVPQAVLPGSDSYGVDLAISGDTIAVSVRGGDSNVGWVEIYAFDGTQWVQEGDQDGAPLRSPEDPNEPGWYGNSVALHGDLLAVGEPLWNGGVGRVLVYERSGGQWSLIDEVTSSLGLEPGRNFGRAVALETDADTGVTTLAALLPNRPPAEGGVDMFVRGAGGTFQPQETLIPTPLTFGTGNDALAGARLLLKDDTLVIGAPADSGLATGVFPGTPTAFADDVGAVFVYQRGTSNWFRSLYLKAPNAEAGDRFGASVAIEGERIVVGAPGEGSSAQGTLGGATEQADNGAEASGAVYVLGLLDGGEGPYWAYVGYLKASNAQAGDAFGSAIALAGDTLICSAPNEDSAATGIDGAQDDEAGVNDGALYEF